MDLTRAAAWALLTGVQRKSDSLLKHARWPSRPRCAAMRASSARTKRSGASSALLHDFDYERWPTLGGSSLPRRRDSPREGLSRMGGPRDPVARRLQRRDRATAGSRRRSSPATRWPDSSPRRRSCARARACSISRRASVVKRMKDKAFARAREARRSARRRRSCWACRSTSTSRNVDRLHARTGRRARAAWHAVADLSSPLVPYINTEWLMPTRSSRSTA